MSDLDPFRHTYEELNVFRRNLSKDNEERRKNNRVLKEKIEYLQGITDNFKLVREKFNQKEHDLELVARAKEYTKNIEGSINTISEILQKRSSDIANMPTNMEAQTFLNLCSNSLKNPFNGDPGHLQSFIDSIELINQYQAGNEVLAVSFVKTRLTGKARDYITTENSIQAIANKLKSVIKPENKDFVKAKITNLTSRNKSVDAYATELETLAEKLKKAYLSDGVPPNVAEQYTVTELKSSVIKNVTSPTMKLLLKSQKPETVQDFLTHYIETNTDTDALQVNHFRNNRGKFYGNRINRGNFHGNFRNYPRNNNSNSRYQNYRNYRDNSGNYHNNESRNNRNYANNRRGQQETRNVRTYETGNENGPQAAGQSLRDHQQN